MFSVQNGKDGVLSHACASGLVGFPADNRAFTVCRCDTSAWEGVWAELCLVSECSSVSCLCQALNLSRFVC